MLVVCVLTRRVNGGLDSFESSPYITLSRGGFSASSLVTTVPVTPSRIACFPFATVICESSLPPPPHTALVERWTTASHRGRWPWQECLRAEENRVDKSPHFAGQTGW